MYLGKDRLCPLYCLYPSFRKVTNHVDVHEPTPDSHEPIPDIHEPPPEVYGPPPGSHAFPLPTYNNKVSMDSSDPTNQYLAALQQRSLDYVAHLQRLGDAMRGVGEEYRNWHIETSNALFESGANRAEFDKKMQEKYILWIREKWWKAFAENMAVMSGMERFTWSATEVLRSDWPREG
jgi:hypothetical protein